MSEIEIHHREHGSDPGSRRVGIMVGVIGVLLSVVTISSHRSHTAAVIHRTEANDQWTYYQAKKIREQASDIGITVIGALAPTEGARAATPAAAEVSKPASASAKAAPSADAPKGPGSPSANAWATSAARARLAAARDKYASDAEKIQDTARERDAETTHEEARALRFDLGEGLLELGLVLCSLYFLARKNFFPVLGVTAAAIGTIIGATGYLL